MWEEGEGWLSLFRKYTQHINLYCADIFSNCKTQKASERVHRTPVYLPLGLVCQIILLSQRLKIESKHRHLLPVKIIQLQFW